MVALEFTEMHLIADSLNHSADRLFSKARSGRHSLRYGSPTRHASSCITCIMHKPCGGTVGPDFERSRN